MAGEILEYDDGTTVTLGPDDAPELTGNRARWLVSVKDFGGDVAKVCAFLEAREEILRAAEALGIPREVFLHFDPNRPGFEERAKVLMRAGEIWAAE